MGKIRMQEEASSKYGREGHEFERQLNECTKSPEERKLVTVLYHAATPVKDCTGKTVWFADTTFQVPLGALKKAQDDKEFEQNLMFAFVGCHVLDKFTEAGPWRCSITPSMCTRPAKSFGSLKIFGEDKATGNWNYTEHDIVPLCDDKQCGIRYTQKCMKMTSSEKERLVYTCATCGVPDTVSKKHSACSRCKATFYCSKACQVKHWKEGGHKEACVKATFDL